MLDVVVYWLQLEGRILCLIVVCIWDIMMRYGNFDCAVLFLMVQCNDGDDSGGAMVRGAPDLKFSNPAGTGFTGFAQKFRPDLR